ncbi:signal peptidase II [Fructilactobacillus carniphilus]|uniref:Lipoprotein signal peptidase n=1 Tax=Fructilactobacillus carniphilus TaxID=2940297 RepID=A0ABY5C0G9_9LACO|nr:signal peptidase II [Fructilactobacillus carniphilus]USS91098.1 signal peptidase II [Fructilactobacillus carniphilus]
MSKTSKSRFPQLFLILTFTGTLLLIIIDQWVKQIVRTQVKPGESINLIPHVLSITNITNSGAAWSFLAGNSWIFIVIAGIASLLFIWLMAKNQRQHWIVIALGLMLAGTIGNLLDRIFFGAVTDMIQFDFIQFPIFNLADCYLTLGVGLILIRLVLQED